MRALSKIANEATDMTSLFDFLAISQHNVQHLICHACRRKKQVTIYCDCHNMFKRLAIPLDGVSGTDLSRWLRPTCHRARGLFFSFAQVCANWKSLGSSMGSPWRPKYIQVRTKTLNWTFSAPPLGTIFGTFS